MTLAKTPQRRRDWPYVAALSSALLLGAGFVAHASCAPTPLARARAPEAPPAAVAKHAEGPAEAGKAGEPNPGDSHRAGLSVTEPPAADSPAVTPAPPLAVAFTDTPSEGAGGSPAPHVDARELPLLASIERELKRTPPTRSTRPAGGVPTRRRPSRSHRLRATPLPQGSPAARAGFALDRRCAPERGRPAPDRALPSNGRVRNGLG
jgi:hypothetical protein